MDRILFVVMILAIVGLLAIGCAADDRAAAERSAAEAERVRAEGEAAAAQTLAKAQAYQSQLAADTTAFSERAAVRSAESAATFERVASMLPYVAMVLGAAAVAGVGLLVWDRGRRERPQAPAVDPGLLLLLDQQRRQLADVERATWLLVAKEQRRAIAGESRVTNYDEHERGLR